MKKGIFVIVTLLCGTLLFAGGSGEQAGSGSAAGGPARLSVTITEDLNIIDYETNLMTLRIEKEANVDLSFNVLPAADYGQKLNLMVMAGGAELTDVIMLGLSDAMAYQWGQEGAIVPLTEYYNDPAKSPVFHAAVAKLGKENWKYEITSPDGEIYGIPSLRYAHYNEFNFKYMYNKPWVDKLGLTFPTTTAEYPAFLRAIANGDGNGNGRRDEIALSGDFPTAPNTSFSGWFTYLMNSFVYAGDPNFLTVNNGKIGAAYATNEWREGLKFMRTLFAEGLIPAETLTQDGNQFRTLMNQDTPVVFSYVWYNGDVMSPTNPVRNDYEPVLPLKGPQGLAYARFIPTTCAISMVISKNCRNVDAAFRMGDILCNEVYGISQRYGAEGVDWDYAANIPDAADKWYPSLPSSPLYMIPYDDATFWASGEAKNSSWRQKGPIVHGYEVMAGWGIPRTVVPGREAYAKADQMNATVAALYFEEAQIPPEVVGKIIYQPEELAAVTELYTSLNAYNVPAIAAFLSGAQDIDSYWSTYIAELNRIGLPRLLSTIQGAYDRIPK